MLTCYLLKGDPTMHTHTLAASGKKLKVEGVTVKELRGVLPDVCQWMLKFAGGPAKAKKMQVDTLFKHMKYTGKPHLCSMWWCLFGDKVFSSLNPKKLESRHCHETVLPVPICTSLKG